jgi:hypothetical protein
MYALQDKSFTAINVYPNPSNGSNINIDISNLQSVNKTATLTITSILGMKILEQEVSNNTSNTIFNNAFPSKGIYIIKLEDGEKSHSMKVLIN